MVMFFIFILIFLADPFVQLWGLLLLLWVLILLVKQQSHILNTLLLLELGMLMSVVMIGMSLLYFSSFMMLLLEFFTFSVCEACLGIGILIKAVRSKGTDYSNTIY